MVLVVKRFAVGLDCLCCLVLDEVLGVTGCEDWLPRGASMALVELTSMAGVWF